MGGIDIGGIDIARCSKASVDWTQLAVYCYQRGLQELQDLVPVRISPLVKKLPYSHVKHLRFYFHKKEMGTYITDPA